MHVPSLKHSGCAYDIASPRGGGLIGFIGYVRYMGYVGFPPFVITFIICDEN